MPTLTIDFTKLSLPLGGEVLSALHGGRILRSPVESPDGLRAMFIIGTDIDDMKAEAALVSAHSADDVYLIPIVPAAITRWDHLGTAPILDRDGDEVATMRVYGGNLIEQETEFGWVETVVMLAENLRRGDLFTLGDARLPGMQAFEVFRMFDDSPGAMVLQSLVGGWDSLPEDERLNREMYLPESLPPTLLVFLAVQPKALLKQAGATDLD
jgi:hypothetical protein